MPRRLFGTDGIRDIANSGNLTPDRVLTVARIIGYTLRTNPQFFWYEGSRAPDRRDKARPGKSHGAGKVLLGVDPRLSGPLLRCALKAGLLSQGVDVIDVGVVPTPVVATLTNLWGCVMGIVVSASHNTMEYNGIKLFNGRGLKMPEETERKLEAAITGGTTPVNYPIGDRIGRLSNEDDFFDDYAGLITKNLRFMAAEKPLSRLKVVLDAANGAASQLAPRLLAELGATVIPIHCAPDGRNINENCGALHPETCAEAVLREKANLGVALDGDADRSILIDEKGNQVDGDFMLAIAAKRMKEAGTLTGDVVVSTVMANLGLEFALREIGVQLLRMPVGDRFVLEKMVNDGYMLGGEQSGHLIFLDTANTGDGLLTALKMIDIMLQTDTPLSKLATVMAKSPQVLINVRTRSRTPLETVPAITEAAEAATEALGDQGRLVLRYSGTEALARVMLEGTDQKQIQSLAETIAVAIKENLG